MSRYPPEALITPAWRAARQMLELCKEYKRQILHLYRLLRWCQKKKESILQIKVLGIKSRLGLDSRVSSVPLHQLMFRWPSHLQFNTATLCAHICCCSSHIHRSLHTHIKSQKNISSVLVQWTEKTKSTDTEWHSSESTKFNMTF